MKQASFEFPQWLNEFVPDDEFFAAAYDEVGEQKRAWLKTCIARLFDWYGPRKDPSGEIVRHWQAGFDTRSAYAPVDFGVVLFDDTLLSPARLLAGLVPAMAGGVEKLLAVRVTEGAPWPKPILTGLELAGQEFVVDLNESRARKLFSELRESEASGAVTVLGPRAGAIKSSEMQAASRMTFWRPRFSRSASVWMEEPDTFDLEVLAFTHPDMRFTVYGAESELPGESFTRAPGAFEDCISVAADVAYLPASHADRGLPRMRLVLGPGQEGCWVWPDLHLDHFQSHCTAWTIGG
ncbi:hypothetical protein GM415_14965 [Pseudodesulfovibrio cashew]|uniref:Uncharacterized protein n=1 Tax=Pseudodesulfovibrio cashew TaxID=2678688 RepID=A0A6I6JK66_9BACT|nr:hypothetical protein [Pseudodesulfovibrio cashew]QGY41368.1 hypothetical protein GM415_14965 [Pseudodesulfovibrio cashew]